MRVVPAAFFGVAERDGPGFGGDEEDFGARREEAGAVERVDYEGGRDGGCCCTGEASEQVRFVMKRFDWRREVMEVRVGWGYALYILISSSQLGPFTKSSVAK